MKKKVTSKTIPVAKNEFRFHNVLVKTPKTVFKKRHPAYVWRAKGNTYDYYTLTHSSKVPGVNVRKLRKNPDPKDKRDSYVSVESKSDIKSAFGKKQRHWKLDPLDREELKGQTKKR